MKYKYSIVACLLSIGELFLGAYLLFGLKLFKYWVGVPLFVLWIMIFIAGFTACMYFAEREL